MISLKDFCLFADSPRYVHQLHDVFEFADGIKLLNENGSNMQDPPKKTDGIVCFRMKHPRIEVTNFESYQYRINELLFFQTGDPLKTMGFQS